MMIFAIIGFTVIGVFMYSCCKVAGDADRREEQFFKDHADK